MNKNFHFNLFNKMPDAYLVVENGLFIDCNEAALQLLQTSIEQIKELAPASVFSAFDNINLQSTTKLAASEYGKQFISSQMSLPNASPTHVKIRLTVISEEEKCILVQVAIDQSPDLIQADNRQSETSTQNTQQLIHTIFEQSPIGIALVNLKNGKILEVNDKFSTIIGRSAEELKHIDWLSITQPEDFEQDFRNIFKLNNDEISNYRLNKRYIKPDNTEVWVRMTVSSFLFDESLHPLHLCMIEDLTELMKAEEALRESELNFRLLFENGPIAIIYNQLIYNEAHEPVDFMCIDANKTYKEYCGIDPIGHKASNMSITTKGTTQKWIKRFNEIARKGKPQRFQEYNKLNDRWYDCSVFQYKQDHFVTVLLDITKQKQTEIKLTESQNLYHSFVEHLPGAVFRKDKEGRYIFVNNKFCEVKGMKAEQIIGKTPRELSDYEKSINRERQKTEFKQSTLLEGEDHHNYIVRTGEYIENEELYIRPDGSKQYFQVVKSPVFGFDGKIIGSQGIQFDITDRKNAESALRDNNNRLTLAMHVANMAWWEMDISSGKIWFEKRKAEILGYPPENFTHYEDFMNLVHPDDYQKVMEKMHKHLVGTKEKYEVEYRIRDVNNNYKYFYDIGSITKADSNGKPLIISGLIFDITERKHAEDALLKSEMFLRTFINNAPFQIWARDDKNIGILENNHFVENFGSILGKSLSNNEFFNGEMAEKWQKYNSRVLNGEVIDEEVSITTKDGTKTEQQQIIFPISVSGKIIGTAGFIIDITERKLVQEALRDSQEQLKKFAAHLQNVREEERILLAREIHDELGQILVAIKLI